VPTSTGVTDAASVFGRAARSQFFIALCALSAASPALSAFGVVCARRVALLIYSLASA